MGRQGGGRTKSVQKFELAGLAGAASTAAALTGAAGIGAAVTCAA
jgi:hypothetical protein